MVLGSPSGADGQFTFGHFDFTVVPEPASWLLVAMGAVSFAVSSTFGAIGRKKPIPDPE